MLLSLAPLGGCMHSQVDIIGLREIARKHIEQIAATNSLIPLPHELLSTDTQSTSLASLVEFLDLSDSNEDRQKVRLWDLRNISMKNELTE